MRGRGGSSGLMGRCCGLAVLSLWFSSLSSGGSVTSESNRRVSVCGLICGAGRDVEREIGRVK